jgi:hypothetical protein
LPIAQSYPANHTTSLFYSIKDDNLNLSKSTNKGFYVALIRLQQINTNKNSLSVVLRFGNTSNKTIVKLI